MKKMDRMPEPINKSDGVHLLSEMTQGHCAYCDSGNIGAASQKTVDHFLPKSVFPELENEWGNLFLCCNVCQRAKWDKPARDEERKPLKPDATDYDFPKYFLNNFLTGEIEINTGAGEFDQERAEYTIQWLGFNIVERKKSRLLERKKYRDLIKKKYELNDFSYRFFVEGI